MFKSIVGESKSVTEEMTAPCTETTLPTILSRYLLQNIFNVDEFGLFYQCLPNKTLHLKGEKCSGGKLIKVHLTGLATGNAYEERLQMFVIGKPIKPLCFKGMKTLPCRYRAQRKSWMSGELFEDWVHELDRKFAASKRKIALTIDNCTAHPHVENLKWIKLIFLPPNTTSHTQPMDKGIVRALKTKYRSLAVSKLIIALERKELIPNFSILSAILDEYIDFDIEVSTTHGKLTNAEIIAEVNEIQEDNSDGETSQKSKKHEKLSKFLNFSASSLSSVR